MCAAHGIQRYDVRRVDFRIDDLVDPYQAQMKLNYLLIRLLCLKYPGLKSNAGVTYTLDLLRGKSIFAKTTVFEAEFYNKSEQQKPTPECQSRLELRWKHGAGKTLSPALDALRARLCGICGYYLELIDELNAEIVNEWNAGASSKFSMTAYLMQQDLKIISREQLTRLFEMLGAKNPTSSMKRLMRKGEIETFTAADLESHVEWLRGQLADYGGIPAVSFSEKIEKSE